MNHNVEMVLTGRVDFLVQKGYDKELIEQIRRKMLQIHKFLEAARSSKIKCESGSTFPLTSDIILTTCPFTCIVG